MLARTATNALLRAASKTTAVANDDHNLLRAAARDYRASRAAYDANEIKRKNSREFVSAGRSFDCAQDKLQQAGSLCSQFSAATSAFDDLSRQRYDKLWRINVLRVVVSFLFRIPILWINARGIWYLVGGR